MEHKEVFKENISVVFAQATVSKIPPEPLVWIWGALVPKLKLSHSKKGRGLVN